MLYARALFPSACSSRSVPISSRSERLQRSSGQRRMASTARRRDQLDSHEMGGDVVFNIIYIMRSRMTRLASYAPIGIVMQIGAQLARDERAQGWPASKLRGRARPKAVCSMHSRCVAAGGARSARLVSRSG